MKIKHYVKIWGNCGWKLESVEQTKLGSQSGNLHSSPDIALLLNHSQIPSGHLVPLSVDRVVLNNF